MKESAEPWKLTAALLCRVGILKIRDQLLYHRSMCHVVLDPYVNKCMVSLKADDLNSKISGLLYMD